MMCIIEYCISISRGAEDPARRFSLFNSLSILLLLPALFFFFPNFDGVSMQYVVIFFYDIPNFDSFFGIYKTCILPMYL